MDSLGSFHVKEKYASLLRKLLNAEWGKLKSDTSNPFTRKKMKMISPTGMIMKQSSCITLHNALCSNVYTFLNST